MSGNYRQSSTFLSCVFWLLVLGLVLLQQFHGNYELTPDHDSLWRSGQVPRTLQCNRLVYAVMPSSPHHGCSSFPLLVASMKLGHSEAENDCGRIRCRPSIKPPEEMSKEASWSTGELKAVNRSYTPFFDDFQSSKWKLNGRLLLAFGTVCNSQWPGSFGVLQSQQRCR